MPRPISLRRPISPVLAAAAIVALVGRANAAGTYPSLRKTVFGGAVIVLALVAPAAVLTSAVAGAYGNGTRLAAAGFDLSLADALLIMAMVAAVPFVPTADMVLRRLLALSGVFQLILAAVVIANPTQRAAFEWGHRLVLVPGAILVGVVLGRTTTLVNAFRIFYLASFTVALAAVAIAAQTKLAPAYPFNLHKNSAGLILSFAFMSMIVAPNLGKIPVEFRRVLLIVVLLGVAATRSRASMVALLPVTFVWMIRSGRIHRLLPATLVAGALMAGVVFVTTESELADPATSGFSGIATRADTNAVTIDLWRTSPMLGVGLRYFRDPAVIAAQPPGRVIEPHNIVLASLAEGGLVGAFALTVLLVGSFVLLRPLRGDLVFLAKCALAVRIISGVFDIFWVAGTGSLPWIFVGIAVGARHRSTTRDAEALSA